MEPRIIVNAKVYPQVEGAGALELAHACQAAAEAADTTIGLAPPMVELGAIGRADLDRVVVFGQHVDALKPGSGTGWTTVEGLAATKASGSLVNHAEHKIPHDDVAARVKRLQEAGLMSLVCTDSMEETEALTPLAPTYIAIEPPELIGGDISVTSADPAIVRDAALRVRELSAETLPLCGAGVKNGRDVAAALELGAYGVLLASGVVKADNPRAVLEDLCGGL